MEDQLRTALLNPVPGEMSEDLHECHHYLRNCGVRDQFDSPLLDSVLEHVRRHFYELFHDQRSVARNLLRGALQDSVLSTTKGCTEKVAPSSRDRNSS